jgi:Glycosyl transferases group 1
MRDAIVFSTWSWETFNVPERVALALASEGAHVLYCEMPVSRFRRHGKALTEIAKDVHAFGPEYDGEKFLSVPLLRERQWKMVAKQVLEQAHVLGLKDPAFIFSHIEGFVPLCEEMKANGLPLVHICMDYPEQYQYELIEAADQTLVIPTGVFHKLKAKYGEKIHAVPQSIHIQNIATPLAEPAEIVKVPRPRLGYTGPIFGRLNLPLLRDLLTEHPEWHFIYFGEARNLNLPNAHGIAWCSAENLPAYVAALDVGVMPYDCFDERNLHCSPLKLFDYFLAGLPVVSTPVISLWEYSELIYFGDTEREFSAAIEKALCESKDSPKRQARKEVARAHSTEILGERLREILKTLG